MTPTLSQGQAEPTDALAERLRELAVGTVEWRVADPESGAYCMCSGNEREMREWLDDHKKRFPTSIHAGKVVTRVHFYSPLERAALEVAAAIESALAASSAAPTADLRATRFIMEHGVWHDLVTGQHLYTEDQHSAAMADLADEAWSALETAGVPRDGVRTLGESISKLAARHAAAQLAAVAAPPEVKDLRDAKWLDPECAHAGACQSLRFKAAAAPPAASEVLVLLIEHDGDDSPAVALARNRSELLEQVKVAVWGEPHPADTTNDAGDDMAEGITDTLLETGVIAFEGDPPLRLFRFPGAAVAAPEARVAGVEPITVAKLAKAGDRKMLPIMRALNVFGADVTANQPLDLALIGAALSHAGCAIANQADDGSSMPSAAPLSEPCALDQGARPVRLSDADTIRRLRSLRVVLGIDSPETRGWAPAVQQEARRVIDAAIGALTTPAQTPVSAAERHVVEAAKAWGNTQTHDEIAMLAAELVLVEALGQLAGIAPPVDQQEGGKQ